MGLFDLFKRKEKINTETKEESIVEPIEEKPVVTSIIEETEEPLAEELQIEEIPDLEDVSTSEEAQVEVSVENNFINDVASELEKKIEQTVEKLVNPIEEDKPVVQALTLETEDYYHIPMIYCYSAPNNLDTKGMVKIGYTEQDVDKRIEQQTHTAAVKTIIHWTHPALYANGTKFLDKDFHRYLRAKGIKQEENRNDEWFYITPEDANRLFNIFIKCDGNLDDLCSLARVEASEIDEIKDYTLREEQEDCVNETLAYFTTHANGQFLWNAKPRFGKTLCAYDLMRRLDAHKVLVLSNRPAVFTSWYADFIKFVAGTGEYKFISTNDNVKNNEGVLSRADYINHVDYENIGCVECVSLQDLKSAANFGGQYFKLNEVSDLEWDLVILDESHEGVETIKADFALNKINRKATLYLSGTPFKALSNDKFEADEIYNWTYVDEQEKKRKYAERCAREECLENPYETLPQLNLYTYQMSDALETNLKEGIMINGELEKYSFDLNDFFEANTNKEFVNKKDVDKFLDTLTHNKKYPYSTKELRKELRHTVWLLKSVNSVKALEKLLNEHPVFENYKIIAAVGSKVEDPESDELKKAFKAVTDAIKDDDRPTITLSVGQLTTGVTIPEWSAILMLSNVESPALYMQAAFRVQNPWEHFDVNGNLTYKANAYVFDFCPERTLDIFEQMANGLYSTTKGGNGSLEERKDHITKLLNYFPVICDAEGTMTELDAEQVLQIPRKIKCKDVVEKGFMSNYLFNGIGNVFRTNNIARLEEILKDCPIAKDKASTPQQQGYEVDRTINVDEYGNPVAQESEINRESQKLLGKKIYGPEVELTRKDLNIKTTPTESKKQQDAIQKSVEAQITKSIVDPVIKEVVTEKRLSKSAEQKIKTKMQYEASKQAANIALEHTTGMNKINSDCDTKLAEVKQQEAEKVANETEEITVNKKQAIDDIDKQFKQAELQLESQKQIELANTPRGNRTEIYEKYSALKKDLKDTTKQQKQYVEATAQHNIEEIKLKSDCEVKVKEKEIEDERQRLGNEQVKLTQEAIKKANTTIQKEIVSTTVAEASIAHEQEKLQKAESDYRDHLRGFSRTIPTFLMAYGDENTTLNTFDAHIPDSEFKNITTLSLADFRELRDDLKVFNEDVFNDAVKEFFRLKKELSHYYEKDADKDIFDYIPKQSTNLIYTPKNVVEMMADMLEKENPGCFDDPNYTFIDIYMKSGLYIAEIVKRLYRSEGMRTAYPESTDRLKHIFAHQVYGLAPTETILNIAKNYVLGFDDDTQIVSTHHNLRHFDALPSAQGGTLDEDLERLYNK